LESASKGIVKKYQSRRLATAIGIFDPSTAAAVRFAVHHGRQAAFAQDDSCEMSFAVQPREVQVILNEGGLAPMMNGKPNCRRS
jgi:hypothetical protein